MGQSGVVAGLLVAVFVVCHGSDASPHFLWIVVSIVLLEALSGPVIGLLDVLPQFHSCLAVGQPVLTCRLHSEF